jgi:hypothetical protein
VKHNHSIFILLFILYIFSCSNSLNTISQSLIGPKSENVQLENYQNVFYVSSTFGSDENGDGSAQHPWNSISFALSQIHDAASETRYAVLVSEGDFAHTPVEMKDFIDLFGGFEPTNWERDIVKHQIILTGRLMRRVVISANSLEAKIYA